MRDDYKIVKHRIILEKRCKHLKCRFELSFLLKILKKQNKIDESENYADLSHILELKLKECLLSKK